MGFADFVIEITQLGENYRAKVQTSPGNLQPHVIFELPFQDADLEDRIARLHGNKRMRGGTSDVADLARNLGQELFEAVFKGEVGICLRDSLRSLKGDRRLRIRLRIGDVPELQSYPWEYLFDGNHFLAIHKHAALVRNLDNRAFIKPAGLLGPLRILVVIASPRTLPELKAESEWRAINDGLKGLVESGTVVLERLARGTEGALQKELDTESYHVLHFIGHGNYDPQAEVAYLAFENEHGDLTQVEGSRLGQYVGDQRSLRLIVLNSCEGAYADGKSALSGVAQNLVQCGIPAVVAMQYEISDRYAILFSETFYKALAEGKDVDEAVTVARRALFSTAGPKDVSWAIPVLYLAGESSKLFVSTRGDNAPERCVWLNKAVSSIENLIESRDTLAWQTRNAVMVRSDHRIFPLGFPSERPDVLGLTLHPSGELFVITCDNRLFPAAYEISRANYRKNEMVKIRSPLNRIPLAISCWPDDSSLFVILSNGYLRCWLQSDQPPILESWDHSVFATAFSKQLLVTVGHDLQIRIYHSDLSSVSCSLKRPYEIHLIAMSDDGSRVALADHGHGLTIIEIQNLEFHKPLELRHWITALALNEDGSLAAFATADADRTIYLLDLTVENGSPLEMGKAKFLVTTLAFSSTQSFLYSGDTGGYVRTWRLGDENS